MQCNNRYIFIKNIREKKYMKSGWEGFTTFTIVFYSCRKGKFNDVNFD